MKREIEFRGLRTDGKGWVYGGYKQIGDLIFILAKQGYTLDHSHEVHPESVGQYTGIKDKNGTKIFEGDVVNDSKDWKVFCSLDGGAWMLDYGNGSGQKYLYPINSHCEVVGNIHE